MCLAPGQTEVHRQQTGFNCPDGRTLAQLDQEGELAAVDAEGVICWSKSGDVCAWREEVGREESDDVEKDYVDGVGGEGEDHEPVVKLEGFDRLEVEVSRDPVHYILV